MLFAILYVVQAAADHSYADEERTLRMADIQALQGSGTIGSSAWRRMGATGAKSGSGRCGQGDPAGNGDVATHTHTHQQLRVPIW